MKVRTLWEPAPQKIVSTGARSPAEIAEYAVQLSNKERRQISQAFEVGNYEMASNFIWSRTMAVLKRELAAQDLKFIGQMLNKQDVSYDDDVNDVVTDMEAVQLAGELGVVSSSEGACLRRTQEKIVHFSRLDASEIGSENIGIQSGEATDILRLCIESVLGKQQITVSDKFLEFRDALELATLTPDDERIAALPETPYFFRKLAISILMAVIRKNSGTKLENVLANVNVLLPVIWPAMRDTEKWQVGQTYAAVYADGKATAVAGLKAALLKAKGLDFVPENLRSDVFVKAAEAILRAHEGANNLYNEESHVRTLLKLGPSIPIPAFFLCASALLAVKLGNYYGASSSASAVVDKILEKSDEERWLYYLDQCLPGDIRILHKLGDEKPRKIWFALVERYNLAALAVEEKEIIKLIRASSGKNDDMAGKAQQKLLSRYYGKIL